MQKILIVDDREENLVALEKVLKGINVEVVKASSGNDALKLLMKNQFALAILDVQMPSMDGYELAELIRDEVKQYSLPIIFVSAIYSDDWHIFKGYESGAVDFLAKPFNPFQLIAKVNVFLNLDQQREYYRQKIDHLGMAFKAEKDRAKHYQLESRRHRKALMLTAELANMIAHTGSTESMVQACLRVVVELMNTDCGIIFRFCSHKQTFIKTVSLGQTSFSEQDIVDIPRSRYFGLVNSTTQLDFMQTFFVKMSGSPYVLVIYDPDENVGLILGNHRESPIDKLPFEEEDRIVVENALNVIILLIEQRKIRGSSQITSQLFERLTSDHRQNIAAITSTQALFTEEWNNNSVLNASAHSNERERLSCNITKLSNSFYPSEDREFDISLDHSLRFEAEKTGVRNTLSKALQLEEERGRVVEKLEYTNRILDATRAITQLVTRESQIDELLQQACRNLVSSGVFLSSNIIISNMNFDKVTKTRFFAGDEQYCLADGVTEEYLSVLNSLDCPNGAVSQLDGFEFSACKDSLSCVSAVISHNSRVYGAMLGVVSSKAVLENAEKTLLGDIADELGFGLNALRREQLHKHKDLELQLILEAADIGTWTYNVNKDRGYRSSNITKLSDVQISGSEFTKKIWERAVHPDDLTNVLNLVSQRALQQSDFYEIEYRIRSVNGDWLWVRDRGRVIERDHNGVPMIVCGTQGDISAQKSAELEQNKLKDMLNQSQKLEPIGRLAGGVAHDFNNLLSVMMGFSDLLLLDKGQSAKAIRQLQTIKQACEKAKDLTTQLLMFSRKQTIQPKVVEWNQLIQESLNVYSRLIEESIEVKCEVGDSLPLISADPQQLDQILANLLINARDAIQQVISRETPPKIIIRTSHVTLPQNVIGVENANGYVRLQVIDNGIGMTEEVKERIFEPFFSTKSSSKGTGLGLATVFGIVEQNKGFVDVETSVDIGTIFNVYWPVTGLSKTSYQRDLTAPLSGLGEKIYVVEDELEIRQYCKELLDDFNYEVTLSSSAEEMMELISGGSKPDLLLTDVVLPGMSGHQLSQEVHKIWPNLPILFMSGYTDEIISQHGVIDPEMNLMGKPFSSDELLTNIRRLLQLDNVSGAAVDTSVRQQEVH